MSGAKHTAGPWRVDDHPRREYPRVTDKRGSFVADCATDADVRLIAAAPELLEALEGVYALAIGHTAAYQFQHQLDEPHPTHQAILDKARAAIAKAVQS